MNTTSYWQDSASAPVFAKIKSDLNVDVAIVGAGITGITAAYLFKQAGFKVALIDRTRPGGFDTTNTTAHLTCVTDSSLQELVKHFGVEEAAKVWSAGRYAIRQIAEIIQREKIECDFKWVPGYYHAPWTGKVDDVKETLRQEAALAQKLGFPARYLENVPLVNRPGVFFENQAKFNPREYLAALLRKLPGRGSHVLANSDVQEIKSDPPVVTIGKYHVRCRFVFLATHNPLMGKSSLMSATLFQTKLFLYTTYAVGARVLKGFAPEASYWERKHPYHYLRVDHCNDHDYLIFGGEDQKTGQGDDAAAYARLERDFTKLFPSAKIDHRWSGQVIETVDGLPYIGEMAPHQYVATGFSGNGMTFGTLGAMMAVDALQRRSNPWVKLFDVHRKSMSEAGHYLKENADYLYYLGKGWLSVKDNKSLGALRRNTGKVVKHQGHKVAAYRDAHGKLSICSAVCTHMKCIVDWNAAEKTWDCPCHGSRFAATGAVLAGPAEKPLEPMPDDRNGDAAQPAAEKNGKGKTKSAAKPKRASKTKAAKKREIELYYIPMG
jgi:glycine/D-amino acid oxidase-like deaminating enzyme/nitrite reductase/ring-hydroxylating ferredoxin subunit